MPSLQDSDSGSANRSRSISRGLSSLTIQNVITSALAFVFLASLLRLAPVNGYTAYSSVLVSVGIAVTVSTFSLHYAASRYVALYLAEDESKAWAAARATLVLSLIFSAVALVVFEVLSPALSMYFMKSSQFTFRFVLGGVWLFCYSFSIVLQGIILGLKKYTQIAKMLVVSRAVVVIFTVVSLELYHDVSVAVISWIIYFAILIAWMMIIIRSKLFMKSNTSYYVEILRYSTPLAFAGILGVISGTGDSVIIGGFTTSLGAYNAAIQISAILGIVIVGPLITTFLPEASSSSHNDLEVSNGLRLAIRFLMLVLLPASLLLAAQASQFLSLFSGGGGYLSATVALEIVAGTYLFAGVQLALFSLLQAVGRTIQILIIGIVIAIVDVAASLFLVPVLGINGGAVSKSAVAIAGLIVAFYFARHYLKNLDPGMFYFKAVIASIVPFGAVLALSNLFSDRTITFIPYSVVGFVLLIVCIKALRILSEEDRSFIAHVLPGQLQRFLRYL